MLAFFPLKGILKIVQEIRVYLLVALHHIRLRPKHICGLLDDHGQPRWAVSGGRRRAAPGSPLLYTCMMRAVWRIHTWLDISIPSFLIQFNIPLAG